MKSKKVELIRFSSLPSKPVAPVKKYSVPKSMDRPVPEDSEIEDELEDELEVEEGDHMMGGPGSGPQKGGGSGKSKKGDAPLTAGKKTQIADAIRTPPKNRTAEQKALIKEEMDKVGGAESFKPLGGEDEELLKDLQAKHESKVAAAKKTKH